MSTSTGVIHYLNRHEITPQGIEEMAAKIRVEEEKRSKPFFIELVVPHDWWQPPTQTFDSIVVSIHCLHPSINVTRVRHPYLK